MSVYDEHKRLLDLISEKRWGLFTSDDNAMIKALVHAGYVTAHMRPIDGEVETRLVLSPSGAQYLSDLSEQSEQVKSSLSYGRRSTDGPRGSS